MMMLFVLNGDNDDREENGVVELDVTRTTRAAKASKLLFAAARRKFQFDRQLWLRGLASMLQLCFCVKAYSFFFRLAQREKLQ